MNEELTKEILAFLNDTRQFISSEAPAAIKQYLEYFAWDYKLTLFFQAVALIVLIGITIKLSYAYKNSFKRDSFYNSPPDYGFALFILGVIIFFFLCIILNTVSSYYQLIHFPKAFLLQKLGVFKGGG